MVQMREADLRLSFLCHLSQGFQAGSDEGVPDLGQVPPRKLLGTIKSPVQECDIDFFGFLDYRTVPGFPALDVRDVQKLLFLS